MVGLSGGLDSTLALLITALAMGMLNRPASDIVAVTMPCFGTTARTKSNAELLAERMGATLKIIDISQAVRRHFTDIGQSMENHDVTFENGQARERTQVLMDIANQTGGLVIGTGDLSELALGWCTYNGDHMSNYAVNCSIPKTLVRHLVAYLARDNAEKDEALHDVLEDILDTPVSPELLPAVQGEISQRTEDLVGPYELHDFFLYYMLRWGFPPRKIYRLALYALGKTYTRDVILKWLKTFYRRFFSQQFKRSCLPDGPKVGSAALSPSRRLADAERRFCCAVAGRAGDAGVNGREEPVAEHRGPQKIFDFLGKEGARERAELLPQAEAEEGGLCNDAADAERRQRSAVAGRAGDAGVSVFSTACGKRTRAPAVRPALWRTAGALAFLRVHR